MTSREPPLAFTLHLPPEDQPEPKTVVLVHGFPDGPALWSQLIPSALEAGYRVVNVALPGYGDDDAPGATSFDSLSERLLATFDAANATKPVLITHDWGSVLAYLLLQRHPDAVQRLVCLDVGLAERSLFKAALVLGYQSLLVLAYLLGGPLGDALSRWICRWLLRRPAYPGATPARARHGWLYRQAWREAGSAGPWWAYYRNRVASWDVEASPPFLFAYGRELWSWAQFHTPQWRETVKAAGHRVVALPGQHWFMAQHPEQTWEAIDAFLRGYD